MQVAFTSILLVALIQQPAFARGSHYSPGTWLVVAIWVVLLLLYVLGSSAKEFFSEQKSAKRQREQEIIQRENSAANAKRRTETLMQQAAQYRNREASYLILLKNSGWSEACAESAIATALESHSTDDIDRIIQTKWNSGMNHQQAMLEFFGSFSKHSC